MRVSDSLEAKTLSIAEGGTVAGGLNATPIGATSAAIGRFTTLATTGAATIGGVLTVPSNGAVLNGAVISQGDFNYQGFLNRCSGVTSVWGHDSSSNRTILQTYSGGTSTTTGTGYYDLILQPYGGTLGVGVAGPGERFHVGGNARVDGYIKVGSYTVATLPTAGTAGRVAYASNGRNYNGSGTLEAAGSGTGCFVIDSGSAWKVAGTNQTVQA